MKQNPIRAVLLFLVVTLALCASACLDFKSVVRATPAASDAAKQEFAEIERTGEISPEARTQLDAVADEAAGTASNLSASFGNWGKLSPAERRQAVLNFINNLSSSADRLEAAGALHLKNPQSKSKFESYQRNLRRAVSMGRIYLASLPDKEPVPGVEPGAATK